MSSDDISLIVLHLEDAGVPVELDETVDPRTFNRDPPQARPVEVVLPARPSGRGLVERSPLRPRLHWT
jgi:hypothetical protein